MSIASGNHTVWNKVLRSVQLRRKWFDSGDIKQSTGTIGSNIVCVYLLRAYYGGVVNRRIKIQYRNRRRNPATKYGECLYEYRR